MHFIDVWLLFSLAGPFLKQRVLDREIDVRHHVVGETILRRAQRLNRQVARKPPIEKMSERIRFPSADHCSTRLAL